MWRPEVNARYLPQSFSENRYGLSSLNLRSIQSGFRASKLPDPPMSASPVLELPTCVVAWLGISCGCWGWELRFSSLPVKHFIEWAIPPQHPVQPWSSHTPARQVFDYCAHQQEMLSLLSVHTIVFFPELEDFTVFCLSPISVPPSSVAGSAWLTDIFCLISSLTRAWWRPLAWFPPWVVCLPHWFVPRGQLNEELCPICILFCPLGCLIFNWFSYSPHVGLPVWLLMCLKPDLLTLTEALDSPAFFHSAGAVSLWEFRSHHWCPVINSWPAAIWLKSSGSETAFVVSPALVSCAILSGGLLWPWKDKAAAKPSSATCVPGSALSFSLCSHSPF